MKLEAAGSSLRLSRTAEAALCAIVLGLAGLTYHAITFPLDTDVPAISPPEAAPAPQTLPVGAGEPPMPGDLGETLARPLFSASRRPLEAGAPSTSGPQPEAMASAPDQLQLAGIIRAGKTKQALIKAAHLPSGQWLREGGRFESWTLRQIKDNAVVLEAAGRSIELRIKYGNAGAPAEKQPTP